MTRQATVPGSSAAHVQLMCIADAMPGKSTAPHHSNRRSTWSSNITIHLPTSPRGCYLKKPAIDCNLFDLSNIYNVSPDEPNVETAVQEDHREREVAGAVLIGTLQLGLLCRGLALAGPVQIGMFH